MSKRLTTSAIIATLLMVAISFYSSAQHSHDAIASTAVVMGG